MKDDQKTKRKLIEELNELRKSVTELKGFEEEIEQIRADHEKFTKAFLQNSIPVAITTLQEGRFIDVSAAFLVFMECKRDEVIGHTSAEIGFITEEQRSSFLHELNKKGRIENSEVKFRTKGGALKYGLFNAVMMSLGNEKCLLSIMTDITERKQAEDTLRESEEKFAKSFEFNPSLMAISDLEDGHIVDVNSSFLTTMGYTREEVYGKTANELGLFPDTSLRDAFAQELKAGVTYNNKEMVVRDKNGALHTGEFSARIINIGGRDHILTAATDITARKQAERSVRDAHKRLLTVLDSADAIIYVSDIDTHEILFINEQARNIWGDITGEKCWQKIQSGQDRPCPFCTNSKLLDACGLPLGVHHWEFQNTVTGRWYDCRDRAISWEDGRFVRMEIATDITDLKLAEDALRDSKQQILNLTDNLSNVVVYQLTAELDGARRFTYISHAVERANEVTEEEVLADANVIYRQVLPAYLAVVRRREEEALKNLSVMRVEVQSRLPSGRLRWFEYVSTPRYASDGFLVWDGVQVDITERKQVEDELARYREGLEKLVNERTQELENRTKTLEEVNIALKVLLQHREEDKKELEDRFVMNVKNLIIPFAEKMKSTNLDERQLAYLGIIETHLMDITSSMIKKMHQFNFTPTEVEVASLIKEGKATKEIAKIIGIATSSVNTHRNNIRKKLGISMEKVNLQSHLRSFN